MLRFLFSSCTAVPNELFFLLLLACVRVFVLHVCLWVPAVLSCFPTVKLHMNNTAAPRLNADHITV